MTPTTQTPVLPQEVLLQMVSGYWLTQALNTAARFGVADRLVAGPRPAEALASEVGAHPEGLYRLMRALAAVGVFAEPEPGVYALTPLSELLREGVPGSLRDMVIMNGNPGHYRAWGELETAIRTNASPFPQVFGMGVFEFLGQNAAEARAFNGAMTNLSGMVAAAVCAAYDFKGIQRLCDVGGGHGFMIGAVLEAHPAMQGVLYDLPQVVSGAPKRDRLEAVAGNFFEGVPAGCDAYLMKHIIHDWSDDKCQRLLGHCAKGLPRGGKVLIIEMVVPQGPGMPFPKLADLNMLVMTDGGKERTESEFRKLLASAGLELSRVVPTETPMCVIEAIKA